jgi:hypothetical protein
MATSVIVKGKLAPAPVTDAVNKITTKYSNGAKAVVIDNKMAYVQPPASIGTTDVDKWPQKSGTFQILVGQSDE